MEQLARPDRRDINGTIVSTAPYTFAEVDTAVKSPRFEVFRHELHRIVGGQWVIVKVLGKQCITAKMTYDRWGQTFMRGGTYEIYDDGSIDYSTDAIRTFWLLRMPDGNYAQWMMGTHYVNSPQMPLRTPMVRTVEAYDALINLTHAKLTDWLTIPSTPTFGSGWDAGDPVGWVIGFIQDRYPLAGFSIPATDIRIPTSEAKLYEPGTSLLEICNAMLLYCNYEVLHANVTGSYISYPFVQPSQRVVEYNYVADNRSILVKESGVLERDIFNAPNQWLRIVSRPSGTPLRSRYTLDDPANPLSTVYRRRTVTNYETVDVANQTKLDELVKRLAEEGQRWNGKVRVDTPIMPVGHSDKVNLNYGTQPWAGSVAGDYIARGWTLECEPGGKVSHLWDRAPLTAIP